MLQQSREQLEWIGLRCGGDLANPSYHLGAVRMECAHEKNVIRSQLPN